MKTVLGHDEVVEYNGSTYTVVAKKWYQSKHYRTDAYMVSYLLEPIEFAGMEHDEDVWVSEADYLADKRTYRD